MKKFNLKKNVLIFLLVLGNLSLFAGENNKVKLLVNGTEAFPQIIKSIQDAENSIYVNMFIWRDDKIGNILAEEILKAADRNVKVYISKDLYGSVCEHAEEAGISFFHKKLSFAEKIKVFTLKTMYKPAIEKKAKDKETELYKKILNHKNISVDAEKFKADHSKFYVFDNNKLILGGVNIEDKENGSDMSGRPYQDYMIYLEGKDYVDLFYKIRNQGLKNNSLTSSDIYFGINRKFPETKTQVFEMENMYLDIINSSQKELTIVMAYFSPLKNFLEAINKAAQRGVKVTIVLPAKANFQDDSNKATAKKLIKLQKKFNSDIQIYFSPDMLHTKLVSNENIISFGSCNITKKAFNQLDELNCFINRNNSQKAESLYNQIFTQINKTISDSVKWNFSNKLKYNHFNAFLESFLV